jgi:SAM-dependent methyltransferase
MNRPARSIESDYYHYQAFDPEHASEVRSFYLQFFAGHEFVIELGCGRGEFLEAARRAGKRTLGVDIDPGMIAETRSRGLDAVLSDAGEFLRTTEEDADAIFAAHLVEHLPVEDTLALFAAARDRLKPGGVLVVVTPNPQCLAIILTDFWNDPTHVRPYTISLLEFLMKESGLEVVASGANPTDEPGPPPELLVPDTMSPWSEIDTPELPPWNSDRLDVTEDPTKAALHALLQRIYDVNHALFDRIKALDARIDQVRHQAQLASSRINDLLRHHYGPNEIYAVGRRPG